MSEDILVKKHSLDSDEEDEEQEIKDRYQILRDADIEGQEDETDGNILAAGGEISITPFNLKEELEEGDFDTQGNYHWKKEQKIRDSWLDNIDWIQIRKSEKKIEDQSSDGSSEPETPFDPTIVCKKMLKLMNPKETVAGALRRLGGKRSVPASQRWKNKQSQKSSEEEAKIKRDLEKMIELTGLADELLTKSGNMDVYQQKYEDIQSIIDKANKKKPYTSSEFNMYDDDFEEKESQKFKKPKLDDTATTSGQEDKDEILWLYKLNNTDKDELHGPYSSKEMQKKSTDGTFPSDKGVFVRKANQEGPFYSSRRVDFELYF